PLCRILCLASPTRSTHVPPYRIDPFAGCKPSFGGRKGRGRGLDPLNPPPPHTGRHQSFLFISIFPFRVRFCVAHGPMAAAARQIQIFFFFKFFPPPSIGSKRCFNHQSENRREGKGRRGGCPDGIDEVILRVTFVGHAVAFPRSQRKKECYLLFALFDREGGLLVRWDFLELGWTHPRWVGWVPRACIIIIIIIIK
ncbi:hypothetical protein B0F90DRAFT_1752390, partial [Multifurca ochricompacta]